MGLPNTLYTCEQVRKLDKIAIETFKIPGFQLMRQAGQCAFSHLTQVWPQAKSVTVFCGTGNNGGDGYVLAQEALKSGWHVQVVQVGQSEHPSQEAQQALQAYLSHSGHPPEPFSSSMEAKGEVWVDAILGTGVRPPLAPLHQSAIEFINQGTCPVLAMDVPSGLDANTGTPVQMAVHAQATVSFIGLKRGMLTGLGPDHCGRLFFSTLNVPEPLYAQVPSQCALLDVTREKHALKERPPSTHKGLCGHVLIIGGGAVQYSGAAGLAATAALRCGAGLVSIAHSPDFNGGARGYPLETMAYPIEAPDQLIPLMASADCVVIGPGLGQSAWANALLKASLTFKGPVVVDADGLNGLSQLYTQAHNAWRHPNWILTPHPKEAARLLNTTTLAVQKNRFEAVHALQKRFHGTIVLKGVGSLIQSADQTVHICPYGNPGMATAGMGDVLSGVIAGLLAQGLSPAQGARLGVAVHAVAGDLEAVHGQRGMLASDLFPHFREVLNEE